MADEKKNDRPDGLDLDALERVALAADPADPDNRHVALLADRLAALVTYTRTLEASVEAERARVADLLRTIEAAIRARGDS